MDNNQLFQNIRNARAQINKLKQEAQLLEASNIQQNNVNIKEYMSSVIYSLAKADNNIEKASKDNRNKLPSILAKRQEESVPINSYKKYKKGYKKNVNSINQTSKIQSQSTKILDNSFNFALQNRPLKIHSHHQKHLKLQFSTNVPNIQIPLNKSINEISHSSRKQTIQTAMRRRNFYNEIKSLKYVNINDSSVIKQIQDLRQNKESKLIEVSNIKKIENNMKPNIANLQSYNEAVDKYSKHQFMIINGVLVEQGPQYASYRRIYQSSFIKIRQNIGLLENILKQNKINFARLNGKKIAYLSLKPSFKKVQLLDCLEEGEEIKNKVIPKKKYEGRQGANKAANVIISNWKMSKQQARFKLIKEKTIIIQRFFKKKYERLKLQKAIGQRNKVLLQNFQNRQDNLKKIWNQLKTKKRIQIHTNSLQVDQEKRLTMQNFSERQNAQLSRIFRLKDQNLVIIYVSAHQLPIQLINYYYRMLELAGISKYKDRLIFIYPHQYSKFPNHFSLGKLLYYSSKTLKQLKLITSDIPTLLVPGCPSNQLIKICDFLKCYLFSAEPQKLKQISTKSQFRRFCSNLRIQMLPGTMQMYDYIQFVNTFAVLILKNPQVQTWVLKIDDEFHGRGISYFQVSKSKYIQSLLKRVNYQDRNTSEVFTTDLPSSNPVNQQITIQIRDYLKQNLAERLKIATPTVYRNYIEFMGRFIKKGGVIQATPPCPRENLKYPCISFCVQPNGQFSIISTYEKIIGQLYRSIGCSFPQTCLDYQYILKIIRDITQSFKMRSIFGYFTLDVVFYQKDQMKKTWILDIQPYLNNFTSSFFLFDSLMKGSFFPEKNIYLIESDSPIKSEVNSIDTNYSISNRELLSRQYIFIPYFNNPKLVEVKIKQFFKQARIEGFNFDIGNQEGLCVMLLDQLTSGVMGLLSVAEKKEQNIERMKQMLQFIAKISDIKNVSYGKNENYTSTDAIGIKDVLNTFISFSRRQQRRNGKEKAIKKYENSQNLDFII